MAGVKETKEVLALAFAVAGILKSELKDGFQAADVLEALSKLSSDQNVALINQAVAGIQAVPQEAADIDFLEAFELGRFVLAEVKKLVA